MISITNGSGTVTNINTYDDHGIPGTLNTGRFQYTGQAWLPELGMYYYKARMYSPTLGRFMQTDPIGYDDGPNWYAYAHGDPVNGKDPSGLLDTGTQTVEIVVQAYSTGNYGLLGLLSNFIITGDNLGFPGGGGGSSVPAPAPVTTVKPKFKKIKTVPTNSKLCFTPGGVFYAPPNFDIGKIIAAGRAGGLTGVSAVSHNGTFDFQRSRDGNGNTIFYSQYTNASNVAVGAYLYGAGLSKPAASFVSNTYAFLFSSNAGDPAQAQFRDAGFGAAQDGSISCLSSE